MRSEAEQQKQMHLKVENLIVDFHLFLNILNPTLRDLKVDKKGGSTQNV